MTISRKYTLFLVVTTVGTAMAVFMTMRVVLRSALENEIIRRGEESAQAFAATNAPTLAEIDKPGAQGALRYNLDALTRDPDVVDARVANTTGTIVAALDSRDVGHMLPSYLSQHDGPTHYFDPRKGAYHFRASIRLEDAVLGTVVLSLAQTPLEAPMRNASQRALVFAGGVALVMTLFGSLLISREVRPLKVMSHALGQITKGEFRWRMPAGRRDEIGDLAEAFNAMLQQAELFFRYNDKMIIDRLIADESLTRPGGRLRDIAVLFGDMRGYTAMSNRRTADQVVRIVNTYFHLFIECIAHWGGVVDKTMGDAIMAVFERADGEAIESHKRKGILCLCYMKAAAQILNHLLYTKRTQGEELDIEPREFGFAMATGRAIIGNIGSVRRMDYTVCGRVVNLASRLEALTKSGEVIIDNFTLKGTTDLVMHETLPPVQPKGFSENEKVIPHRILGLADAETHQLRIFLKKIFTYSFIRDMLMPANLGAAEEQQWCKEAELLVLKAIAETPATQWFVRVDVESGKPLPAVAQ